MKKKHTVLLIEDDKFLVKLYRDKLNREEFEVSLAITGEEGLNKIRDEKPDVVLLDIILPEKNGFEVLSEMRLDPEIKDIPVIILTNLGQESDVKTGLELGAKDYLVKTEFSISKLSEKIRKTLASLEK